MKKACKILTGFLLIAVLLTGMMPVQAQAKRKISFPKEVILTAYQKPVKETVMVAGLAKKGRIIRLRSDNTKVLTVSAKYDEDLEAYVIRMKAKRAGNAKVTFTVKTGKTGKKFSCDVTVKKYVSPFRCIKVSGKNITSKMKQSNIVNLDYKKAKEKVSFKLKKDWEFECAYFNNGDYTEDAILNNLRFEDTCGELTIPLWNTKTGQQEICYIRWK